MITTNKRPQVQPAVEGRGLEVFTAEALEFIADLHRRFNPTRLDLLRRRVKRQARVDQGKALDFSKVTRRIRDDSWSIAPVPGDLIDRRVEITGPTDRKMIINALNSGAKTFMADFEDANTPAWRNVVEGQVNLRDAVRRTIEYASSEGKEYRLNREVATLLLRPRGWHLPERHIEVDREPASASLVDFGLFFFHNAKDLVARGTAPYFYLPKMESHLEARLWNDVFGFAEDRLGVRRGTIKATALIETFPAAFEMEEILYELRDHAAGLNAGRWDYLFSIIKTLRARKDFVLPDRAQLTMTVPFMRAYTELLVKTCHRRRAHAIGGMAAFVPSRKDPQANEVAFAKVREDKAREADDGFDGTWVAHPDLVPVAREIFDRALQGRSNQLARLREDVAVSAHDLLDVRVPGGKTTEAGLRSNVRVAIQYLEAWLRGTGAVTISNLMEDTATAEIARSQVWQWVHHGARLEDERTVHEGLVRQIGDEELDRLRMEAKPAAQKRGRFREARTLFDAIALKEPLVDFLTIPAYGLIE
jgi:malate synthase